jgi:catechol 2,3-dioxygenase-like lactoylglutathione lyase family enzyme
MPVQLNHTIVHARDRAETAQHLAEILGLPEPTTYGPFLVVELANGVSLDVMEDPDAHPQHYAFLVADDEFDAIHGRITDRGLTYWADPSGRQPGVVNTNDGGRGLYWEDPTGHKLEILTVPYGGWPNS